MLIKQGVPHLSTHSIEFECFPLTLIAGENGSGKTQLLTAISNGYFAKNPQLSEIRGKYYNYTISINMGGNRSFAQYRDLAEKAAGTLADFQWVRTLAETRDACLGDWRDVIEITAKELLLEINAQQVLEKVVSSSNADLNHIQEIVARYSDAILSQVHPFPRDGTAAYKSLQRRTVFCPDINDIGLSEIIIGLHLTENDVPKDSDANVVDVADTFMRYFYKSTLVDEARPFRYTLSDAPIKMSRENFRHRFGAPPWERFEQVLSICGLSHFELLKPKLHANYTPYFLRLPEQKPVSADSLSSGEKVMLALALLAYQGPSFDDQTILLLDEVDALLNPALTAKFIEILQMISEDRGAHIIVTTHSPTTAALWPNESMYLMIKDEPRIVQRGQSSIVNMLSANLFHVVTKSFKIALVEDRDDADFYTTITQIAASRGLMSRGSLFWLSCRELHDNTADSVAEGGKQVVKGWLDRLSAGADANLICALCDHDSDGKIATAMHVTTRYSIENYQYDPLVGFIAYLMYENPDRPWIVDRKGISLSDFSATEISEDFRGKLQGIVAEFSDVLAPSIEAKFSIALQKDLVLVDLINGVQVDYPKWLTDASGHNLVSAFCDKYKGVANRRERLLKSMQAFPAWLPKDILDVVGSVGSS